MLKTLEDSVVVTTTASHVEPETPEQEDELTQKPRGFFADQFEVLDNSMNHGKRTRVLRLT